MYIVPQFSALFTEQLKRKGMQNNPFLHSANKKSLLGYTKAHLDKNESFWKNILWRDATHIETLHCRKRRAFQVKNLLPVKYGGGSITLWGCVARTGTGKKSVFPEERNQSRG